MYTFLVGILYSDVTVLFHAYSMIYSRYYSLSLKKTLQKTFHGPHAQYDFLLFLKKNHTAHAVRGKFFRSVENILKCIYIRLDISLTQFSTVIVMFVCFCFSYTRS